MLLYKVEGVSLISYYISYYLNFLSYIIILKL